MELDFCAPSSWGRYFKFCVGIVCAAIVLVTSTAHGQFFDPTGMLLQQTQFLNSSAMYSPWMGGNPYSMYSPAPNPYFNSVSPYCISLYLPCASNSMFTPNPWMPYGYGGLNNMNMFGVDPSDMGYRPPTSDYSRYFSRVTDREVESYFRNRLSSDISRTYGSSALSSGGLSSPSSAAGASATANPAGGSPTTRSGSPYASGRGPQAPRPAPEVRPEEDAMAEFERQVGQGDGRTGFQECDNGNCDLWTRRTDGDPSSTGGEFRYPQCAPPQRNIATANLPTDNRNALEQILEYHKKPASGNMARCIFQAQLGASPTRMAYCDNGVPRPNDKAWCVSQELHRMIAHAYDDITKCLGEDPRRIFSMILQESRFAPNAKNPTTTAHGIGQYVKGTLAQTSRDHQSVYMSRVDAAVAKGNAKDECERVKKIYTAIPVGNSENELICQSISRPQHMINNMFNTVIDHVRFREDHAKFLRENLVGTTPPPSELAVFSMAEMFALLSHHDGDGRARQKRTAYLGYLKDPTDNRLQHLRSYLTSSRALRLPKCYASILSTCKSVSNGCCYDPDIDQISAITGTKKNFNDLMEKNFPEVSCF